MANVNEINANDWSLSIDNEFGIVTELDDIRQCILIIMATQKGSDPFRPEFGIDVVSYIDLPINQARIGLTREIVESIQIWEPRAEINSITATIVDSSITFNVVFQLAGDATVNANVQTNITI